MNISPAARLLSRSCWYLYSDDGLTLDYPGTSTCGDMYVCSCLSLPVTAHLWSSIFNMACDLGLVEDAYTAALSNPQHDLAEDEVRRLVLALVEQGKTWALRCYHGTV